MIVTTIDRIDGYQIAKVCGLVFGRVGRVRGLWGQIQATVESIIGGEGKAYSEDLGKAKTAAIARAEEEARNMGANAILGVDLDITEIREGYLLASITGTAVILEKIQC